MRAQLRVGRLVHVTWQDSILTTSWCQPHEADSTEQVDGHETVGWVVALTRRAVTVASSRSPGGAVTGAITIPIVAVTRVRILKVPR